LVILNINAGHGVRYEEHNYLIPIGANSDLMQEWQQEIHVTQIDEWKQELNTTAMKTAYVSNMLKAAGNQVNLIILDACRNLPFLKVRGLRTGQMALPSGLNQEKAKSGFLIAYAASPFERRLMELGIIVRILSILSNGCKYPICVSLTFLGKCVKG
jgi:uncharacterized caspase-like protein